MGRLLLALIVVSIATSCKAQPNGLNMDGVMFEVDSTIEYPPPPPPPPPPYDIIYEDEVVGTVDTPKDKEIHHYVDDMPVFQLNDKDAMVYLKAIPYDKTLLEKGTRATTFILLVIDSTGAVTDPMINRSSGNLALDETALNYVLAMPNWIKPGYHKGKAVKVYYTLPFRFEGE